MVIREASALLTVMIMTAVIGVISFGLWRNVSMSYDIVLERERYYKNFYMTDLVLSYGIETAKKRFVPQELDLRSISAKCFITKIKNFCNPALHLRAVLYSGDKIVFNINCRLTKCFLNEQQCFFVENYTIGTIV